MNKSLVLPARLCSAAAGNCSHRYIGKVCCLLLVRADCIGRAPGRGLEDTGKCSSCYAILNLYDITNKYVPTFKFQMTWAGALCCVGRTSVPYIAVWVPCQLPALSGARYDKIARHYCKFISQLCVLMAEMPTGRSYQEALTFLSRIIQAGRAGQKSGTPQQVADSCKDIGIELSSMRTIHIAVSLGSI